MRSRGSDLREQSGKELHRVDFPLPGVSEMELERIAPHLLAGPTPVNGEGALKISPSRGIGLLVHALILPPTVPFYQRRRNKDLGFRGDRESVGRPI